jgi:hypothetical protein
LMFRYAKGKPLAPKIGLAQSAAMHGFMRVQGVPDGAEIDRALCLTLDAYTGITYPAPGDAVAIFNNMKAACATIADGWDNVEPPPGAVI